LLSAISELLEQTGSSQSKLGVNDSFATTPTNRTVRS
jgi:hypothetical protein